MIEKDTSKKMPLIDAVIDTLPDGDVVRVMIGLHWTAVVLDVQGEQRCGLASTLSGSKDHGEPDIPQAGELETMGALELAALVREEKPPLSSVGAAAVNALLPHQSDQWSDINASEIIARHGAGKSVAVVGHFPFISQLRTQVGELNVLEQNPQPGDFPADLAKVIIPKSDVVAITGTTLINHSLDDLLALCSPDAVVLLLGPTTFLSPVLFRYHIDLLCGSIVTNIGKVLKTVEQGGNFRQVHQSGVQLVCMSRMGALEDS